MTSSTIAAAKKRILSGAKPTADSLHLGNYIGAVRNWVDMQSEYDAVFFIPDLHAITVDFEPSELANRTRVVAAQYIAAGIDPDRARAMTEVRMLRNAIWDIQEEPADLADALTRHITIIKAMQPA